MSISYRNQSIDLQRSANQWTDFYMRDLGHQRVNRFSSTNLSALDLFLHSRVLQLNNIAHAVSFSSPRGNLLLAIGNNIHFVHHSKCKYGVFIRPHPMVFCSTVLINMNRQKLSSTSQNYADSANLQFSCPHVFVFHTIGVVFNIRKIANSEQICLCQTMNKILGQGGAHLLV